jgi:multiple sugar transport system permease protein
MINGCEDHLDSSRSLFIDGTGAGDTKKRSPSLMSSLQVKWGLITAGTVIAIVPTIVFFAIVQRRLVAGLTAGAVK